MERLGIAALFNQDTDFRMGIKVANDFEFALLFKFEMDSQKKQEIKSVRYTICESGYERKEKVMRSRSHYSSFPSMRYS